MPTGLRDMVLHGCLGPLKGDFSSQRHCDELRRLPQMNQALAMQCEDNRVTNWLQ